MEKKGMRTAEHLQVRDWPRLAGVLLVAMSLGLLGVLLALGTAQAHDHQMPQTVLKKGAKNLQAGIPVGESSWDRLTGDDECLNVSTIYRMRFPETDRVAAGSKLRVRVSKEQRPDSFEVAAYRTLDEEGEPSGEGRLLKRSLKPVTVDGRTVAWDAVFSVNRPDRHYYLVSEGRWQDSEGCGNEQFAYWSFHVKTRA
jgi:hypothetical protein